jgi:hypothetical protein
MPIYSSSSTALPASCPLLCLVQHRLLFASCRTQYAAKHWHSGHCLSGIILVGGAQPCLSCILCLYLRAMLACFLFRAVLVLHSHQAEHLAKSLLALLEIVTRLHPCTISKPARCKTISHPISRTQKCDHALVLSARSHLRAEARSCAAFSAASWLAGWLMHAENNLLPTLCNARLFILLHTLLHTTTTPQHLTLDCWGPSTRVRCNHFSFPSPLPSRDDSKP